jgi:hypothetical protein
MFSRIIIKIVYVKIATLQHTLNIACQVVNPSKQDEQDEGPQLLGLNYIMTQSVHTITIKCCKNSLPRSRTKVHVNSLKHYRAMQLSHIWTIKEMP